MTYNVLIVKGCFHHDKKQQQKKQKKVIITLSHNLNFITCNWEFISNMIS